MFQLKQIYNTLWVLEVSLVGWQHAVPFSLRHEASAYLVRNIRACNISI